VKILAATPNIPHNASPIHPPTIWHTQNNDGLLKNTLHDIEGKAFQHLASDTTHTPLAKVSSATVAKK
jgi:hypothetical protein